MISPKQARVKRLFDVLLGLFLFPLLIIPIAFLILIATCDTQQWGVFSQVRIGQFGRPFKIYKIRTLKQEVHRLGHLDASATALGKLLRQHKLDELPQLFNVLKGDMSLVGPRPPLPSEVEQYERWQLRRLSMRPGITCIWQIAPNRNSISFDEWMRLDLQYIDTWSLKIDFMLLIRTIQTVTRGSGS